jgi:ParB family chromosome partitioning protein
MAEKKAAKATGKRRPRRKRPAEPVGLAPADLPGKPPAELEKVARSVESQGGAVLASYRDPVGGHWLFLVSLPIDRVEPTPYQRAPSKAHVEKIARVLEKVERFLDPIILSPSPDGRFWTPNGNHRLEALKKLNARTVVGLLVPEEEISHQILALNTEKAYNLREKALGVLNLLETLSRQGPEWSKRTEESLAFEFDDPALLTLGLCYRERPRLSGGAYHPLLKRIESFFDEDLARALEERQKRARRVLEVDDAVTGVVSQLKERGFQSPYLRAFVVARVNPLRFHKGEPPRWDETMERVLRSAQRFDLGKVKEADIARTGGPPPAPDEG